MTAKFVRIVLAALLSGALPSVAGEDPLPFPAASPASEPIVPVPLEHGIDARVVALGKRLFHDVRLSRDDSRSCATCHPLERGGMDGRKQPLAADGSLRLRNTPTIFNAALSGSFNWDGIADTLEAHAEIVLLSPKLMNTSWDELLAKLHADPEYVSAFTSLYAEGIARSSVLDALANFERSLITPNARFDRFLRRDPSALDAAEQDGYRLFKSYGCATCHQGVNVGGNLYQKFGVFEDVYAQGESADDPGRFLITGLERDRGVFRVPSLRNVAVTAPYFHDGRAATLDEAIEVMGRVQLGRKLNRREIELLRGFLLTLTGEYLGEPVTDHVR